jgi:hypothetical protein
VFPVRYELNLYMLIIRNSVPKGLIRIRRNLTWGGPTQLQVTKATNSLTFTRCMNLTYAVWSITGEYFFSVYCVCSVSIDNILVLICEM